MQQYVYRADPWMRRLFILEPELVYELGFQVNSIELICLELISIEAVLAPGIASSK